MDLKPWFKVVELRKEVREGRTFNPDEFAIALEQVVAGTAPEDYRDPAQFFSRTCFTRALREHTGMVLRRLSGQTNNTAPVLTLITQFGGGKTHTLTTLYHLATNGEKAAAYPGVLGVLRDAQLDVVPQAKVAVFVGNAWDPQPGRETPWIDIAWQLAGAKGVAALGASAKTKPPGTEAIGRLFQVAGGTVLLLFDELLNFMNRHRDMADSFYSFIQNFTVAMTGAQSSAAVISLPRSQVEMTDWDLKWQDKITKVVRRVAKDLIVNDEAEIAEVIRRRMFEDIGAERDRKQVAKAFSDWCYERRAQLPPEWTAVDTAASETRSRELLYRRMESCYPFHPATLSVFQRKWQALPQYQQTRGTLAMLAQWISWAYRTGFNEARAEPLITLGSAPLEVPDFRSVVLGQLGESKLIAAIETDIAGLTAHARALDADTKGPLKDIHRRVGAAILFESSGGQTDKAAHLPELRFALGEPRLDTASIDHAAIALASRAYYIRRVGSDGFKIHHQPTLKKVVNDRRAGLDEDGDVRPAMRTLVQTEFERGRTLPACYFPADGAAVPDSPKLMLLVMDPEKEWGRDDGLRERIAEWTRKRGSADRLYPGALVWCLKRPGKDLHDKVETWLAWRRVKRDIDGGTLAGDFDRTELGEITTEVKLAEQAAKEEVWASYSFLVLLDIEEPDGLKTIDIGSGHASAGETLCGRVIAALKSSALLNESPGAGYLERRWPPALKESGAWPLVSLRQAFLSGAMERLLDVDAYLRTKIPELVDRGDFGLASGHHPDGTYERLWYKESLSPDEVSFEADVFLLKKAKAEDLKKGNKPAPPLTEEPRIVADRLADQQTYRQKVPQEPLRLDEPVQVAETTTIVLAGLVPPEVWNRLGTKLIPKLRAGSDLKVGVGFSVTVSAAAERTLVQDLRQILEDLGISDKVTVARDPGQAAHLDFMAAMQAGGSTKTRASAQPRPMTTWIALLKPSAPATGRSRAERLLARRRDLGSNVRKRLAEKFDVAPDKSLPAKIVRYGSSPAEIARYEAPMTLDSRVFIKDLVGIDALMISTTEDIGPLLRHNPNVYMILNGDDEDFHLPQVGFGHPTGPDVPWHLASVAADRAQADGITGEGIWIGFADSGIDASHPEFADRGLRFAAFDSNGEQEEAEPHDPVGHGTHVSGIAAGRKVGIAPKASIAMAKVVRQQGTSSRLANAQVIAGINWLASLELPQGKTGVDVINLSLSTANPWKPTTHSLVFKTVINRVRDLGIEVVATIGNSGPGVHGSPGNYVNVLGIGAIDQSDCVWANSGGGIVAEEGGILKPDFVAPGVDVYSALPDGGYGRRSGTSMAAPVVAGLAALLMQRLGPDVRIREELQARAQEIKHPDGKHSLYKVCY